MSATVFVTDYGFGNLDLERAAVESAGHLLRSAQCRTPAEVIAAAGEADVLLVQWAPISAEVLAALPRCRGIVRYGIGIDNIDLAAATARGVPVCNVPDYCVDEVADHTLALALALGRQLPSIHARVQRGDWTIVPPTPMPAFRDLTFACAGLGRIGRAVLRRAAGFGFRLAAFDPLLSDPDFAAYGARRLGEEELFEAADVLSLHLPLTPRTRHFVGAAQLRRMRPRTILVNTSRGELVDTRMLARCLEEGRLGGAGLDVFESEPLEMDHPLRKAPNVLLTSHTAWYSSASACRLRRLAAEEAIRLANGETPSNPLNRRGLAAAGRRGGAESIP